MSTMHIGTSGWSYPHWRGPFYPDDLSSSEWLDYYARRFATVEINNSFYKLPKASTLEAWAATVPPDFVFAVKASRYITHMKKLKDADETVPRFLELVRPLARQLGPVLFQLPPNWRCNADRLERFLDGLPRQYRYVLEFRDPSWFDPRVYELLSARGVAFCIYELDQNTTPLELTADFAYVRLHGPGGAYQGSYDDDTLRGWADTFEAWNRQGRDVYCYFDNDEAGYAAANAARLRELTKQ